MPLPHNVERLLRTLRLYPSKRKVVRHREVKYAFGEAVRIMPSLPEILLPRLNHTLSAIIYKIFSQLLQIISLLVNKW